MSTWTNAPTSRAVRRIGRSRSATRSGGRLGVEGVEPGGQARQLEREVDARDRPAVVAVDLRDLGLGGQRAGQAAEQVEAGLLVGVGLGLADDRLAEQVGGEGEPLAAERLDGRERLGRASSPAMNRRAMCVAADPGEPGQDLGRRASPAGPGRTASRSHQGTRSPASSRYSRQVAADRLGVVERGHGVDEPEELDLDRGVAQGQVHQPVVPPGAIPGRRAPADPVEQGAADLAGPTLQRVDRPSPVVVRSSVVDAIKDSSPRRDGLAMPLDSILCGDRAQRAVSARDRVGADRA